MNALYTVNIQCSTLAPMGLGKAELRETIAINGPSPEQIRQARHSDAIGTSGRLGKLAAHHKQADREVKNRPVVAGAELGVPARQFAKPGRH